MLKVILKHNEQLSVFIKIVKSRILFNSELQLINSASDLQLLKTLSYTITINATQILSNSCAAKGRISLITLSSGMIILENVILANNTNFENIIHLHSSSLLFKNFTKISGNYARFILRGTEKSYYVHAEFSVVHLSENFVYSLSMTSLTYTHT